MTDKEPRTRSQEHVIEIDAPIEAVWKALTEAEELKRWYVQEAEVEPGEGGRMWVSFGEGMAGSARIEIWEPGRRLRLSHLPPDREGEPDSDIADTPPPAAPIIEDYLLETSRGVTVLRLVTSGIPDTPDWDGFYDGTNRGWELFFRMLRRYLEKHQGEAREHTVVWQPIDGSIRNAWEELMGEHGLGLRAPGADLEEGRRYAARTSGGDELEGEVLMAIPPSALVISLENIDDSIFAISFDQMGDKTFLYASLSSFGELSRDTRAIHNRWREWLSSLSNL